LSGPSRPYGPAVEPGYVRLHGYIAGPNGEHDWIITDPDIDFRDLMSQYDTVFMGRRTFAEMGGRSSVGMRTFVLSRTFRQEDYPEVTIVSDRIEEQIQEERDRPGKDICLFGGGERFRCLLELNGVDTVEPAIIPVILGAGRPFLPSPTVRRRLVLTGQRHYSRSGTVLLQYNVAVDPPERARKTARKTTTS
jgi:dihydrofolate reductase